MKTNPCKDILMKYHSERSNMYPKDDIQYEDVGIAKVTPTKAGWDIVRQDGWSFWVESNSPVEPKPFMRARFYGKGIGYTVRGLFLDGQKVFYRTEAEQKEKDHIDWYGANAREWLKRWDNGQSVWSISMGGFGPGYEQCIQITAAEIIRILLSGEFTYEDWKDPAKWESDRTKIDKSLFANKTINALGLSGAQHGAALNIAVMLWKHGPVAVMTDERVKDRHIQVSKNFPKGT